MIKPVKALMVLAQAAFKAGPCGCHRCASGSVPTEGDFSHTFELHGTVYRRLFVSSSLNDLASALDTALKAFFKNEEFSAWAIKTELEAQLSQDGWARTRTMLADSDTHWLLKLLDIHQMVDHRYLSSTELHCLSAWSRYEAQAAPLESTPSGVVEAAEGEENGASCQSAAPQWEEGSVQASFAF